MSVIKGFRAAATRFLLVILLAIGNFSFAHSQSADTTFYLITCGTGTQGVYSYYGHSALRMQTSQMDIVYNWGVFDFNAPFFVWNFAKGRLNYMLFPERFKEFIDNYFLDQRYVISQKINLNSSEKRELAELVNINLRPENIRYRYDFFYNNCSTRIRDLLEKTLGEKLVYPKVESAGLTTFRDKITEYQKQYPWYQFGTDMLLGTPTERKAGFREKMFLPIEMMQELSASSVNRSGVQTPLLSQGETILDFPVQVHKPKFWLTPLFIFSMLLIIIILITSLLQIKIIYEVMDIFLFSVFSLLSILMVFFNFFAEHSQTKWNFNIVWLNPFIIICLIILIMGYSGKFWFRMVFVLSAVFLVTSFFLPQVFNIAIYPLLLILLVRSSARAGFSWNPIAVK
jgi:hypothetical protein